MKSRLPLNVFSLLAITSILLFLAHCKEKVDLQPPVYKKFALHIDHEFTAGKPLMLNQAYYEPIAGDSFVPTTLVYHINHIVLSDDNGNYLNLGEKYAMVDLMGGNQAKVCETDFMYPERTYNKISFTIGVEDSVTNADGLLNSVFTAPMYWGMINGYVHLKLEGSLKSTPEKSVVLHVGGYMGNYKLAKRITVNIPQGIDLSKGNTALRLNMELAKYFDGVNKIDMNSVNLIHEPNDPAKLISENWQGMFSLGSISYH